MSLVGHPDTGLDKDSVMRQKGYPTENSMERIAVGLFGIAVGISLLTWCGAVWPGLISWPDFAEPMSWMVVIGLIFTGALISFIEDDAPGHLIGTGGDDREL